MKNLFKLFFTFLLSVFSVVCIAQQKKVVSGSKLIPPKVVNAPVIATKKLLPIAADSDKAIKIPLSKKGSYGPTVAPNGFGEVKEIKSNKKNDPYFFEVEHNTAWYYFDIVQDGEFVFEIIPEKNDDDYDFLLFKSTDSSFCNTLKSQNTLPVRTNISRPEKGGANRIGLLISSQKECIHSGKGESFSKPVQVKKGERYYLVLDNVYPNGGGHTINLGYPKEVQINGTVLSEDNKPLKVDVIIEDSKGNEVLKMQSDSLTGKYEMNVGLWENSSYSISFLNDNYFVSSKEIDTDSLAKVDYKLNDIQTVLPKLKGGRKYILGGINFYGSSSKLLPTSFASVNALYKLMKKNKKMRIRIEGHVNNPNYTIPEKIVKPLSEERAKTVYNYLLAKGIEKERMSSIGKGDDYMLYPKPKNEEEQMKNRRVEINVISIE